MKQKIARWLGQLTGVSRHSPAETAVIVYSFVIGSMIYEGAFPGVGAYAFLLPVFFAVSFILNRVCVAGRLRLVYYLSPLLAVPFLWTDPEPWVRSAAYPVTLAVCVLAVLVSDRLRDNRSFVGRCLRYVHDLLGAGLLSLAAFLAVIAIYYSIVYIFNILEGIGSDLTFYASLLAFDVMWPVGFLAFNRASERERDIEPSRFLDVLLNYVLSPAVILYTLILYAYFAKILALWSLPKGGIAYLVFAYGIVALVAKACQLLLLRPLYGWYYRYFSLISLPALLMFWIGVGYRIRQYGLTEDRAYLVVCGAIMTLTVLMFLSRRTGRYLYAAMLAAGLLALFTYIPGISAESIGVRSQLARFDRIGDRLGLLDSAGRIIVRKAATADTTRKDDYRRLYESLGYVRRERGEQFVFDRYGITGECELRREVIPAALEQYASTPWADRVWTDEAVDSDPVRIESRSPVDIAGFDRLIPLRAYDDGGYHYSSQDTLRIFRGDSLLLGIPLDRLLAQRLEGTGYTPQDTIPADSLRAWKDRLLQYDTGAYRLVFSSMSILLDPAPRITDLDMEYILGR